MTTDKSNVLIAEFVEYVDTFNNVCKYSKSWMDELKYHCSWNWLAPVLEKICRMQIGDGITYVEYAYPRTFGILSEEDGQIMVRLNGFGLVKADTLLEATYLAVVDFIEYYNKFLKDNASNNQS